MKYTKGWKYRLEKGVAYKLQCPYDLQKPSYDCRWFSITEDGWLILRPGYAWDGATKFPDFGWMMTPSAIHDALHVAIQEGIIPESQNDLIDKELELAIEGNMATRATKRALRKFRGWYVRKATNTVDEHKGDSKKVYEAKPLKHEISLNDYYRRYGR